MKNQERFEILTLRDYIDMMKVNLAMWNETKEHIILQSIHGHALQGHGMFKDKRNKITETFPEANLEDIVLALGKNPIEVKKQRQLYINEVADFIYRLSSGEKIKKYTNTNNKPLFRIDIFNYQEIKNPASVLIGFYLGSRMDNYTTWRIKTEKEYGIEIGGGECIGINRKKAEEKGIDWTTFATKEHSIKNIEDLTKQGVLCAGVPSSSEITHGYVRYKIGPGTSDDLAIILAGKLYDKDAALGVFLADAIDTWDKYTPFIYAHGQDEQLGTWIEDNVNNIQVKGFKLPTEEEILKFIYLISENNYINMISESQRYFLQIDSKAKFCPIQSHLEFLRFGDGNRKQRIEELKKELEIAKEEYKNTGKKKNKICKDIQKRIDRINTNLGLKKIHIGHINSGLTNIQLYKQFEEKFNEVYCKIK